MDFEVSNEAATMIAQLLRNEDVAESSEVSEETLSESIATLKIHGSVQLRGFDPELTDRLSSNLRFRVDAANLGNRIRVILDIQK